MIVNKLLVNSGATIKEINAVRKHLSLVKGGQLAREVHPAAMITLILSDVTGDPLDVIASGPTVPDPTTFKQAKEIIAKYDLSASMPGSVISFLNEGVEFLFTKTIQPSFQLPKQLKPSLLLHIVITL